MKTPAVAGRRLIPIRWMWILKDYEKRPVTGPKKNLFL
jgi:hypothetical protein